MVPNPYLLFCPSSSVLVVPPPCAQRFAAWRSGGYLAQKFNRRTALEPTTKLSYEALHPPLRQTAVRCCPSFLSCCFLSILLLSLCVGLVALLQNLALAWACAVLQMCHQMRGIIMLCSYIVLHQLFDFFCLNIQESLGLIFH